MKNFLKSNSYYIIRLMGTQVGLTIFAMMLGFASATVSTTMLLISSVASVLFYLWLLYSTCWEMGIKNAERIEAGRLHQSMYHGFFVCIAAYAPVILLLVLLWIGYFAGNGNLYHVVRWLVYFVFSMYHGIVRAVVGSAENMQTLLLPLLYTVSLLPGIVTCGVAYVLGRKGIALFFKPKQSVE